MKLPWHVIILFGCLNLSSPGFAQEHRRYENLGNPTEYLYHVSADRVKTALEIFAQDKSGDLKGGFLDDGQLVLMYATITPVDIGWDIGKKPKMLFRLKRAESGLLMLILEATSFLREKTVV
jgi:hypothetical protein